MKGTLYILRNRRGEEIKTPKGVSGSLDYGNGNAILWVDEQVQAVLNKVSLRVINPDGIGLTGVEEITTNRFIYQEWWFKVEVERVQP